MAAPALVTGTKRGGLHTLLEQGASVKQKVVEIADKFIAGPDSPLNELTITVIPDKSLAKVVQLSTDIESRDPCIVPAAEEAVARASNENIQSRPGGGAGDDDNTQEDQFKEIMREYEKTAEKKYRTGVDPDSTHSVEDLWKAIDNVVADYNFEDQKGPWEKVRLALRKLGDGSGAMKDWLGLLPTESHYLSVVCGGLKLIINAASRMRKVAQEILEALCKIPLTISSTQRVLNIFKDSQQLKQKSKALYESILGGLGHMLEYLKRNAVKKALMAGLKQQSFESGLLDDLIGNITKNRDAFNDEAELCHKEALQRLQKRGEEDAREIKQEIRTTRLTIEAAKQEEKRARDALVEGAQLLNMRTAELSDTFRDFVKAVRQLLTANPKGFEHAYHLGMRLDEPGDIPPKPLARRASVTAIIRNKTVADSHNQRRKLLSRLDYDPNAVATDVEVNYRLGSTLSMENQERSLYVIRSSELSRWVQSKRSTSLIIHGNSKRVTRKSGLSFVCARIVYVLDQIRAASPPPNSKSDVPSIIPLYFFCGQHVTPRESWESPAGIVNSLLAQLLTHCKKADLSKAAKLGRFDSGEVDEVMERFEKVLHRLPPNTMVFCVIDGLSFYVDEDETKEDAEYLIDSLTELVETNNRSRNRLIFKLLITAPARLRVDEEVWGDSKVLRLPDTVPNTGGFTAMKWDMAIGKRLNALGE